MNDLKNFGFTHKSGILMPVFSLPSPYGIGTFGAPCRTFLDFLENSGQTCWQVLPLHPTAYGDSPYQSPSSFAGNPYFLDPEALAKKGLLTRGEVTSCKKEAEYVDYGWLWNTRFDVLRRAHGRFRENERYRAFCRRNAFWLDDYAYFSALKVHYGHKSWNQWQDKHRLYAEAQKEKPLFEKETAFWKWLQYEFFAQWSKVRKYAAQKGVVLIGDMPMYVAYDSADVWSRPQNFLLQNNLLPEVVAGCPPDGFSPDGQLWGNPIYDWRKMREEKFDWWIRRLRHAFSLYDIVRIDHFRAFAGYYEVPYGEKTAHNGRWQKGVGAELFRQVERRLPDGKIIAEDLGFITEDVRKLLAECRFPGMKVLQFAFSYDNSEYLPRMYDTDNCVVYTATHDSECTRSWCEDLGGEEKRRFDRECPHADGQSDVYALIGLALRSRANLAVVPLADYLELPGKVARINTPATAEGNWKWRATDQYVNVADKILRLTKACGREKEPSATS